MSISNINKGRFAGILFCLLSVMCGMNSCKKLVEIDLPSTSVTTPAAFSTNDLANSVMAGIYSQMMNNNGAMTFSNGAATIFNGLSADELVNFSGTTNVEEYQLYTNTIVYDNSITTGFWQVPYKVLYSANAAIEGIAASTSPQLDDSSRREFTGEAKFIRAFCYFYLTNLFGDVPLVLTNDFTKTALMPRTPQADVYKQMVLDLLDAKQLMRTDFSIAKGERIRPNRYAATALLARVYLYQRDWANAAKQADSVIANSQFSLVNDLNGVFLKNSPEAIWQLQQNAAVKPNNSTWEAQHFVPIFRWSQLGPGDQATFSTPAFFTMYASYLVPHYTFSAQLASAFEGGDKRKQVWVDSIPSPDVAPYNGAVYYYPVKYTQQIGTVNGPVTQYYMVLRLAEQYLISAEAKAQLDDINGAATALNALRMRAGLPNTTAATKEAMLAAIAHERQTELFAEWGHRWMDLKRTNKATAVLGAISNKQPFKAGQLLYPIPPTEITNDPNLQQNPEY